MEEKKARIPAHHTGVGAHSGGPARLPSCVSLFIHKSADSRKCLAPNESHTRTWHVSEKKEPGSGMRRVGERSEWSTERGRSNKKGNIGKSKRRQRWCGANSQRNLKSLLSRLKWKKIHISLQWIKTGSYTLSWFLSTFKEEKSWAFGDTSRDEVRISTSWTVSGGLWRNLVRLDWRQYANVCSYLRIAIFF